MRGAADRDFLDVVELQQSTLHRRANRRLEADLQDAESLRAAASRCGTRSCVRPQPPGQSDPRLRPHRRRAAPGTPARRRCARRRAVTERPAMHAAPPLQSLGGGSERWRRRRRHRARCRRARRGRGGRGGFARCGWFVRSRVRLSARAGRVYQRGAQARDKARIHRRSPNDSLHAHPPAPLQEWLLQAPSQPGARGADRRFPNAIQTNAAQLSATARIRVASV